MDPGNKSVDDSGVSCWRTAITSFSTVTLAHVARVHLKGETDCQQSSRNLVIAADRPTSGNPLNTLLIVTNSSTGQKWNESGNDSEGVVVAVRRRSSCLSPSGLIQESVATADPLPLDCRRLEGHKLRRPQFMRTPCLTKVACTAVRSRLRRSWPLLIAW